MSETESVRSAAQVLANDPKIATIVAAGTAAVGATSWFEVLQGWMSIISMSIGILTACVVFAIQSIKLALVWKEWREDQQNAEDKV